MERRRLRIALNLVLASALFALASITLAQQPGPPPRGGGGPGQGGGMRQRPPKDEGFQIQDPLLRRVFEAQARLRYSGTRNVEFREEGERRQQVEFIIRDRNRQRTEYGAGPMMAGTIIIEDDQSRMQYFPDRNEIEVSPSRLREANQRMKMAFRGLSNGMLVVRKETGGRIAGIDTTKLVFNDRRGNVIQVLWVDPENGMILKRELRDPIGGPLGSFEFTKINYEPHIDDQDFRIERKGAKIVNMRDRLFEIARRQSLPPFRISENPQNPRLITVRPIELGGHKGMAQLYGFDEGRVSLFVFDGPLDQRRIESLARGEINTLYLQREGISLLLVGDLPPQELQRLSRMIAK